MKNYLIYCPDMTGHRYIFINRVISTLNNKNHNIILVTAGKYVKTNILNKYIYKSINKDLYKINYNNTLHINVLNKLKNIKKETKLIKNISNKYKVDTIIFIDGDLQKKTIYKINIPNINIYTILIHSEFLYQKKYRINKIRRIIKNIKNNNTLTTYNRYDSTNYPRKTKILWEKILDKDTVKGIFCMDDKLLEVLPSKKWIYLDEFGHRGIDDIRENLTQKKYDLVKKQYYRFIENNKNKENLLLFGDVENRKGYDVLLRLADKLQNTILVRIGRMKAGYTLDWETLEIRERLLLEGRILELDVHINDGNFLNEIFDNINLMILPYREHYRTSGVLIDAIWHEVPLLVSDNGVIARKVLNNELGLTFSVDNIEDLVKKYDYIKNNITKYRENVKRYKINISKETISRKIERILR